MTIHVRLVVQFSMSGAVRPVLGDSFTMLSHRFPFVNTFFELFLFFYPHFFSYPNIENTLLIMYN